VSGPVPLAVESARSWAWRLLPASIALGDVLFLLADRPSGVVAPAAVAFTLAVAGTLAALQISAARAQRYTAALTRDLREAVALQDGIVRGAGVAIIATDSGGSITHFNPAAELLLGRAASEVTGKATPAIFLDRAEVEARAAEASAILGRPVAPGMTLFAAIARGETPSLPDEWTAIHADGQRIPVALGVTVIADGLGRALGLLLIARDLRPETRAREMEARLAAVVGSSGDAIFSVGLDQRLTSWNPGAVQLLGYSPQDVLGRHILEIVPEHLAGETDWIRAETRAGRTIRDHETYRRRKDGALVEVAGTFSPLLDGHGAVIGVATVLRDISARQAAERAAAQMFTFSIDMLAVISADNATFLRVNPAWERSLGYTRSALEGTRFRDIIHPEDLPLALRESASVASGHDALNIRVRMADAHGNWRWVSFNASGANPARQSFIVARDVTHEVEEQEQLEWAYEAMRSTSVALSEQAAEMDRLRAEAEFLASHDPLTGVYNRRAWFGQAAEASPTAVAIFDIDLFKRVNDTYGHPAGDAVLREVGERLARLIGEAGAVGRIGGEEFAAYFTGPLAEARAVAAGCIAGIAATPVEAGNGLTIVVAISGGFAPWRPQAAGSGLDALATTYEAADRALYRAKEAGRGRLEADQAA